MKINERWIACLFVIVCALAMYGVFKDYSYWVDELFSVSASLESWQGLLDHWLLPDVHPPLYQLLLKSWILLFGDSEPATRSLSLVFALSTILFIVFYGMARRELKKYLVFAAMMASMPFFLFYAQETRSYSMMLFLSTVVMLTWLDLDKPESTANFVLFCLAALLLALTHYFGLILSGLLLLSELVKNRRTLNRKSAALIGVGFLCLVWPFYHVIVGGLLSKTTEDFGIEVDSPLDTIGNFASNFMPVTAYLEQKFGLIHGMVSAAVLVPVVFLAPLLIKRMIRRFRIEAEAAAFFRKGDIPALTSLILIYLVLVIVIDVYIPFSQAKSFITLMPAVFLLITSVISQLERTIVDRYVISSLLFAYLLSSLVLSIVYAGYKQAPHQDYRGTAIALGLDKIKSAQGAFLVSCETFKDSVRSVINGKIEAYYLNRLYPNTQVHLVPFCTESRDLLDRKWDFLLANHVKQKEVTFLLRSFPDLEIVSGSSDKKFSESSFSFINFHAGRIADGDAKP
jgi:uncharacterized membrane protein